MEKAMPLARGGALVVIPCAAAKLAGPAIAAELYLGANWRYMLEAAGVVAAADHEAMDRPARVMILSAKHGLVELGQVLDPYDVKMGDAEAIAPDAIAAQLLELAPEVIMGMLPNGYRAALEAAVRMANEEQDEVPWIEYLDVYGDQPWGRQGGIGWQRGVAAALVRAEAR